MKSPARKQINKDDAGTNNILAGSRIPRVNLNAIGRVQPRLGAEYLFPMNHVAHDEVHGGVYLSMVFEY